MLVARFLRLFRGFPVARSCQVCGKGFSVGNQVTIRGKAKYLGGVGTKVTGITRRKFKPNLQRLRVTVGNGTNTTVLACTQCIKSGHVTKLVRRKPFHLPKVENAKPAAEEAVPSGPRARP
jgi:large subunit ribosomal protein L28